MADVRAAARDAGFPRPILFTMSPAGPAGAFFGKRWPSARVVIDGTGQLYEAFGLGRATLSYFTSPGSLRGIWRAMRRGFFYGRPGNGVLVRAGMFLADAGRIAWQHEIAFNGDHPDLAAVPRNAARSPAADQAPGGV